MSILSYAQDIYMACTCPTPKAQYASKTQIKINKKGLLFFCLFLNTYGESLKNIDQSSTQIYMFYMVIM